MSWKTNVRNERGAVLAIVAGAMIFICGMAALAIDVGHALSARTAAQRTVDAMALAAASAFVDNEENAEPVAIQRADAYASSNPVFGITAAFNPATDIEFDYANRRVRVWAHFTEERGNPMRTFFARVLGIDDVDVITMAAAEAVPADRVGCLTPWALPDAWIDDIDTKTLSDGSPGEGEAGKFDYDDADGSRTPSDGDTFDTYCPCETQFDGSVGIDGDYMALVYGSTVCDRGRTGNRCTGYGSDYRTDYDRDRGRPLTLKPGNPAQSWSPGWFMAWRPPENMGGADYRQNIINCIDEDMFTDESIVPIDTEQGNMIGPTIQGVEDRIGEDTHYWDPLCAGDTPSECVINTAGGGGDPLCGLDGQPSCEPEDYAERKVTIPLMDPSEVMRNGLTEIQFRGFISMFLDDPSGNDITGHIIGLGGAAGGGGEDDAGTGALPLVVRLVE
jgi:hypothetical protein